jgi:hypothetical protein
MTSSSVSVQGLTYQITCVSLENCLTSGVHLTPKRDPRVTQASNGGSVLFATKVGKRPGRGSVRLCQFRSFIRGKSGRSFRMTG